MMANILLWDDDDLFYTEDDIIVLRKELLPIMKEFARVREIPKPAKCYVISENVEEENAGLFLYYVKLLNEAGQYEILFKKGNYQIYSFFNNWFALISSLNKHDFKKSTYLLNSLKNNNMNFFSNIDVLLSVLEKYVDNVLLPLVHYYPYSEITNDKKTNIWHTQPICYFNKFCVFIKSFETLCIHDERGKKNIQNYVNYVKLFWCKYISQSKEEKTYTFSAYLYFLANYYHEHSFYNFALLLVHRALDYYFQYLGMREGLIIEVSQEYKYRDRTDMISLMNSEYALRKSSVITSDTKRGIFLTWLNRSRNLSIFTHNVYGTSAEDSKRALMGCHKIIKDIEGNIRWHQLADALMPRQVFHDELVFLTEPSIDTYCWEEKIS